MKKFVITIFILIVASACSPVDEQSAQNDDTNNNQDQVQKDSDRPNQDEDPTNEKDTKIVPPEAKEVLADYKSTFMQVIDNSDQQGQVENFDTKEELVAHFTSVMSEELADWHVNTYFREDEGALFVIPTDAPTWFIEEQPYEMHKINEEEFRVMQERNNEMIGHVMMNYILSYDEDSEEWVVEEIKSSNLEK